MIQLIGLTIPVKSENSYAFPYWLYKQDSTNTELFLGE